MTIDFEAISRYNEEQLGKDRASRMSQVAMYADSAHFIYELIQNADDADATSISFMLTPDKLVVEHNGSPFTESDVKNISYFGKGKTDVTKIGHFGLGFKSVFAYTSSPKIYSDEIHFEIVDLYSLAPISGAPDLPKGYTRFELPFDHIEKKPNYIEKNRLKTPEKGYDEIKAKLSIIGGETLLFTKQLKQISWETSESTGQYSREDHIVNEGIRESHIVINDTSRRYYLVFSRPVIWNNGDDQSSKWRPVEIAFRLDKSVKNHGKVVPISNSKLCVFFATDKIVPVGFILQGPYRTTPPRDNIPFDDLFNQHLIRESSLLLMESLAKIRDLGLLDVNLLVTLPFKMTDEILLPLYHATRDAFKNKPLLPTEGGGHIDAQNALLARGRDLIDLLSSEQISMLFNKTDAQWLDANITQDKFPELRKYLLDELGVQEITPDKIATQITEDFLKIQIDAWMVRFYSYLKEQKTLWREKTQWSSAGALRSKPIIRLADDRHVIPFSASGKPNAYLPSAVSSNFPSVKSTVINNAQAKEFLKELGLMEPDEIADVLQHVLPKYEEDKVNISESEHLNDANAVIRALETDSALRKMQLVERLKVVPFFMVNHCNGSNPCYKRPIEVYFSEKYTGTRALEIYFEGNERAFFISDIYLSIKKSDKAQQLLRDVGVSDVPRSIAIKSNLGHYEKRTLRKNDGCTEEGDIKDYDLDGLSHCLKLMNFERSVSLWSFLLQFEQRHGYAFFRGEYQWRYYTWKSAYFDATFLKELKKAPWLFDKGGQPRRPSDITLSELHDGYTKDAPEVKNVIEKLQFKRDLEQQYLLTLPTEEKEKIELVKKLPSEGIDDLRDLIESYDSRGERPPQDTNDFDFGRELNETFHKLQTSSHNETIPDQGVVQNPERRRDLTTTEIKESIELEPLPAQRVSRRPRIVWESKNENTRVALKELYQGRCQICDFVFSKRNGEPYFEGLYLVSRANASWIDRLGNVLCLCANCCAKVEHGTVEPVDGLIEKILSHKLVNEGGSSIYAEIKILLCGREETIRFKEKHIMDLQEILKTNYKTY